MRTKITTLFFAILFSNSIFAQWTAVNSGLPATTSRGIGVIGDTLFTGVYGGGVYYSVNNGDSWTAWSYNGNISNFNFNYFVVQEKAILIMGESLWAYYEQGNGIYNLSTATVPNQSINCYYKEDNPDTHFMGTDAGLYYSDNGVSWTMASGISSSDSINDIGVLTGTDDEEYVSLATDSGIYKSTDYGVTFSYFGGGLPNKLRVNKFGLLTLTADGVYMFDNDSQTFTSLKAGGDYFASHLDFATYNAYCFGDNIGTKISLIDASTENIALTGVTGGDVIGTTVLGDNIFICTENGGVFRKSLSGSVGINSLNDNVFSINPNPSNGNFVLSVSKPTVVDLLDSRGILIESFVVQNILNVSENLASGLYFLQERGSSLTKKLIVQ